MAGPLQAAALEAWGGRDENIAAGQRAFAHRAKMNGLAATGGWKRNWKGGLSRLSSLVQMKADRQRHHHNGDGGDFPEIAAPLQARQAEGFDDVQAHQKNEQHGQDFLSRITSLPPCDADR